MLLCVVAGKGFQHENNITVCCSKETGNLVEIVVVVFERWERP